MTAEIAADWESHWLAEPQNDRAADDLERSPQWRAQERLVLEHFGSFENLRVIEVGAGRGLTALLYARRGSHVTLLDLLDVPLRQAAAVFAADGRSVETVQGDVFELPAELRDRFDVAMSYGLCEHFLEARRAAVVKAHLDLVRPGGIAMLGVPNARAPVYRLWMATMKSRGTWPLGTEVPFTRRELKHLARAAGGRPLPPRYGSFVGSVVNHGVNQTLYKLGRPGVPVPNVRLPLLDRMAYELVLPVVRPSSGDAEAPGLQPPVAPL